MNSRNGNRVIYLAAGAVGVLLVLWIMLREDSWSWVERYRPTVEEPYDASVTYELLKRARKDGEILMVTDTLLHEVDSLYGSDWSYFFLGNMAYLDPEEQSWLLEFVEKGNDAMIISSGLPLHFLSNLVPADDSEAEEETGVLEEDWEEIWEEEEAAPEYWIDEDGRVHEIVKDSALEEEQEQEQEQEEEEEWSEEELEEFVEDLHEEQYTWFNFVRDTVIDLKLEGSETSYPVYSVRDNFVYPKRWSVFTEELIEKLQETGHIEGTAAEQPNFIRIDRGKGHIWLHSTPLAFTNYHLTREEQFEYVSAVLNRLSEKRILWDRFNAQPDFNWNGGDSTEGYEPKDGPLAFVLSQKGLRWAWFLLLGTALTYLLLGMKRKQRPIPVIHSLPNTSIKFASTLSQLYLKQNDHRKLCMLKWRLFLDHVREQYGIPTHFRNDEERDKLIRRIAIRSGWSEERMKELFDQYKHITIVYVVDDDLLYDFHHKLNTFYRESK